MSVKSGSLGSTARSLGGAVWLGCAAAGVDCAGS